MITLHRGFDESPNCWECPCARQGKPYKPVRANGALGGLCLIGGEPSGEEIMQGYPFVGPGGKVVNIGLKNAGLDKGACFITKAILCRRPADDAAFDKAVECCRPRLQADLELAQPTTICALGGTAMRALALPVTNVGQARGTVQYSPLAPSVPVIGTIHPAAILRGGAGEMAGGGKQKMNVEAQALFLFADIEKAARVAYGEILAEWSDDILIIHDPSDVAKAMDEILVDIYAEGLLGLDLEWVCEDSKNALDALGAGAHRALITLVGVGCPSRAVSFKWDALIASPLGLGALQAAMEDEALPKVAHNKQADRAVWEAQVGPIRGRLLCSMLLHHAACPGIDHDLQQVVSQYLCVPPWKVNHKRQIAEHDAAERERAKLVKAEERAREKVVKVAEHEQRNAEAKAKKLAEKAAEKVERDRLAAEAKVAKAAEKAERQAAHAQRNADAKAAKEARKAGKKSKGRGVDVVSEVDPR
jgi:uracil-DNA glycosylase family 4